MKRFIIGLALVSVSFLQANAQTESCCVKCPEGCCWAICDADGNIIGYSKEKPDVATLASILTDTEAETNEAATCSTKVMSPCSKIVQAGNPASSCCSKSASTGIVGVEVEVSSPEKALVKHE